jgi:hypothetical protein
MSTAEERDGLLVIATSQDTLGDPLLLSVRPNVEGNRRTAPMVANEKSRAGASG